MDTQKSRLDDFSFRQMLGEGSQAVLYKAIRKSNKQAVAIKRIDKNSLSIEDLLSIQAEIEPLIQMDHPNIVKLYEAFVEKDHLHLLMELMTGGELFDRLEKKKDYNEKDAIVIFQQIVAAVSYSHSIGIVHEDLGPENLLLQSSDPAFVIKITGFGLEKVFSKWDMPKKCGNLAFYAPEKLMGGDIYDRFALDYWNTGIILYSLLCGYPPFYEETNDKLFQIIKEGKLEFPSPQWDTISDTAKDLIKNLLNVDPKKRYNAEQILKHPWIIDNCPHSSQFNIFGTKPNINESFAKRIKQALLAARKLNNLTQQKTPS